MSGQTPRDEGRPEARLLDVVLGEIRAVADQVDERDLRHLADSVMVAPRVFVTGEGRSGFMAKAFAMRLMHLGILVHVIAETTTPAVGSGDLLVAVSGSGTTAGTVRVATAAVHAGARVYAVTSDPESQLATSAENSLILPGATKGRRAGEPETVQPLSSLFDQVTHVALDVVCLIVFRQRGLDNAGAANAHANTE
jgi:6-phospho-3-hexuloisomerase